MNNAYAQDNEISWVDWTGLDGAMLEFTRRLTAFRAAHPVLRRRRFLNGVPAEAGQRSDIAWFSPDGTEMHDGQWEAESPRALAYVLDGTAITELGPRGERIVDDSLLIMINGEPAEVSFVVPHGPWTDHWLAAIDTSVSLQDPFHGVRPGEVLRVAPRSVLVLVGAG
jgi:glycogen operon protein